MDYILEGMPSRRLRAVCGLLLFEVEVARERDWFAVAK
jgi:hypothetical protein